MSPTKERVISREIDDFLRMIGCAVYSTEQGYRKERGGTRTTPGIPDKIVIHPQAWLFVEVKNEHGKLTEAQDGFRQACHEAGIPWELWRSVDDAWQWAVGMELIEEG